MTTKEFLKKKLNLEIQINDLEEEISELLEHVEIPPKETLRSATLEDVKVGNIFFYFIPDDTPWYAIIAEILFPDDDFKAYVDEEGCRHGLYCAFVEK